MPREKREYGMQVVSDGKKTWLQIRPIMTKEDREMISRTIREKKQRKKAEKRRKRAARKKKRDRAP